MDLELDQVGTENILISGKFAGQGTSRSSRSKSKTRSKRFWMTRKSRGRKLGSSQFICLDGQSHSERSVTVGSTLVALRDGI